MTTFFTKSLCSTVLAIAMLASCSRPVAYFQRGPVQPASRVSEQSVAVISPVQQIADPSQATVQAGTTIDPSDVYAKQTSELPASKSLTNHVSRIERMLVPTTGTQRLTKTATPQHLTGIERLMLRKVNKQISRQLAPNQPQKAMIKKGKLIGSVVLLIAGLLMLIFGTGTLAFIGLIVSLVGAVGTIVSLIGIDSY
ncbi:hypothetical protein [Spirosoma rhododendri]|nr:hypothetical protein [Spirosoma rhododendri]